MEQAANCEWTYADHTLGRLAKLNPFRWSGAISFQEALEQLAESDGRAISLRVPAGVRSKKHRFDNKEAAIAFIKTVDPEACKIKAEEIAQALQNAAKVMDDCESKLRDELQKVKALEEQCKAEGISLDDAQAS